MHSLDELLDWIDSRKRLLCVSVEKISLDKCSPWYYDEVSGQISNQDRAFFSIAGIRQFSDGKIISEHPIIIQDEIGFLGIIACKINDTWHYLMQAKIEPGNVNVVQISPTLQATKSNFTGRHGGKVPEYLDLFLNMNPDDIIVDQIQSEQASRFYKKRNRNVILVAKDLLEETDTHRWMTLRQIKAMLRIDNLVNMDTRTVLSCIPYVLLGRDADVPFNNKPYFYNTAWNIDRMTIVKLYHYMNDYKMLYKPTTEIVPLMSLDNWYMAEKEFVCRNEFPFKVIFCDIAIEGREVSTWKQPLIESNGKATFGLMCCDDGGMIRFLVKMRPEVGCFDSVEIGPTLQREYATQMPLDTVETLFFEKLDKNEGVVADCILSEEGGRFFREQNRNVILLIDRNEIENMPQGYVWSDYGTLNILTQINNCINIQLRNLLSLLEI